MTSPFLRRRVPTLLASIALLVTGATEVHPQGTDAFRSLRAGDYGEAVRARRAILGLNPLDMAEAYFLYANALAQDKRPAEAKRAVLQALEEAPGYREAQQLLLQIVDGEI